MFDDVTAADVLRFDAATIEGGACMGNTMLHAKGIALSMQGATIKHDLQLRPNFQSAGYLLLRGVHIEGLLSLSGAKLTTAGKALNLDNATIQWNIFLRDGFQSAGEIRMIGAEIGGQLDCAGAVLAAEGVALSLNRASVRGSVLLRLGFEASGEIQMLRTQIDGDLDFEAAAIGPFTGENMVVGGDLVWRQITVSDRTSLNLQGARLKRIHADEASWPTQGNLKLIGLTVEDLCPLQNHCFDATARIAWLNLQPVSDLCAPQPWTHLAELFAAKGYEKSAGQVRSEFHKRQSKTRLADSRFKPVGYVWSTVVAHTGERAPSVLYLFLFMVSLGAVLYVSGGLSRWPARFLHRGTQAPQASYPADLRPQPASPLSTVSPATPSQPVTTIPEPALSQPIESSSAPSTPPNNTSFVTQPAPEDSSTKLAIASTTKNAPKRLKKTSAKKLAPHHVQKTTSPP